jgi:hypothetical protein
MKANSLLKATSLLVASLFLPVAGAQAQTYLVDFGGGGFNLAQTNAGLLPTASPDINGSYWNNSVGGNFGQPSNLNNLVSTANLTSSITLTWTNWGSGVASANMGVTNVPVGSGLASSPLNIVTAVADSVFTQSLTNPNYFRLSNLVPNQSYNISIFAARTATDVRFTDFTVTGDTVVNTNWQTSGTNLSGAGINYSTTPWDILIDADSFGVISVAYKPGAGSGQNFAYLNAMSLEVVPEPSTLGLLGLAAAGTLAHLLRRRRR